MIDWTPQKVKFIVDLAAGGMSRSRIGIAAREHFGDLRLTKGAVTAKIVRSAGYVKQASPIGACRAEQLRRRVPRPPARAEPLPCVAVWQPPPSEPREPREERTCCFPIGNPRGPRFRFCDKPVASRLASYCPACAKRVYLRRDKPKPVVRRARLPDPCDRLHAALVAKDGDPILD